MKSNATTVAAYLDAIQTVRRVILDTDIQECMQYGVIAEAICRVPVAKYLEHHVAVLARMGKRPDGKPLKKSGVVGVGGGAKANGALPKGKTAAKSKPARKETGVRRG